MPDIPAFDASPYTGIQLSLIHIFQPDPALPYVFVMGKKLKKGPESYEDVKYAVIKDYQAVYQDAWLKDLKRKYKVEINQEEMCIRDRDCP